MKNETFTQKILSLYMWSNESIYIFVYNYFGYLSFKVTKLLFREYSRHTHTKTHLQSTEIRTEFKKEERKKLFA